MITAEHNFALDQLIDAKLENILLRHRCLSAEHRLTQIRAHLDLPVLDLTVLQRLTRP